MLSIGREITCVQNKRVTSILDGDTLLAIISVKLTLDRYPSCYAWCDNMAQMSSGPTGFVGDLSSDSSRGPETRLLHKVRSMLDARRLNSDLFEESMLFGVRSSLSAAEYDDWWNLLKDPLFVTPDTLQKLLGLRDSTTASPQPCDRAAIFYIRTFTLTVSQLHQILKVLIDAKITFANRVLDWQAKTANLAGDALVFLRYGGTSQKQNAYSRHLHDLRTTKGSSLMRFTYVVMDLFPEVVANCLVQEIPHLEIMMNLDGSSIDIREQLVICLIQPGSLNIAIGGAVSSIFDMRDKALFRSLRSEWTSRRSSATQEISYQRRIAIRDYACKMRLQASTSQLEQRIRTTIPQDSQNWANMISEQATPKVLHNGRSLLLIIGHSPPFKELNTLRSFWKSDSETSKILLNSIDCLGKWEGELNDAQETNAELLVQEGFLPFVNLYSTSRPTQIAFEPAVSLLRSYLQVVRPLIIFCMGKEVCARSSSITIPRYFAEC